MALVSLHSEIIFPFLNATLGRQAQTLDAASEGIQWFGIDIPRTGTLTHVVFCTATHTSNATMDVRIEGIGSNGLGSGALLVANANGSILVNASNSIFECPINGGTGVSVTAGAACAVLVSQPSSSPGNTQLVYGGNSTGVNASGRPAQAHNTSGSWAKDGSATTSMVGFIYSSGIYVPISGAMTPVTGASGDGGFNSGSSPDERGNRLLVPFACRVSGIWTYQWNFNNNDYKVNLRNSSDTLIASSATVDGDNYNGGLIRRHLFTTPVTLSAGAVVHATLEAMTGSDVGELQRITVSTNAQLGMNPGGADCYKVVYTNGASRTYTDTQVLSIGLLIDQLHDGASASAAAVVNSRATSHLRR